MMLQWKSDEMGWPCAACGGRVEAGERFLYVEQGGCYCFHCAITGIRRAQLRLDAGRQKHRKYIEQTEEDFATLERELSEARSEAKQYHSRFFTHAEQIRRGIA